MSIPRLRVIGTLAALVVAAWILALTVAPADSALVRIVSAGQAWAEANGEARCLDGLPCTVSHTLVFIPLGVALALLYATSGLARRAPRLALLAVIVFGAAFAAVTELGQIPSEQRVADPVDWVADVIGLLIGLLGGSVLLRWLFFR